MTGHSADVAPSILFSEMRPGADWEDRFNQWYDGEHIPVRLAIDGFRSAQRYHAAEDDNYLVVYDMTSLDVLKTPDYVKVKDQPGEETRWMLSNVSHFTRYLGSEIGREGKVDASSIEAPVIFAALFDVPAEDQAEFDAWMVEDHVPLLLKNPDWLGVRRFALSVGEPVPYNRLAIHYLASSDALQSPFRAAARDTEWRKRLVAEKPWFSAGYAKAFHRHGQRFVA